MFAYVYLCLYVCSFLNVFDCLKETNVCLNYSQSVLRSYLEIIWSPCVRNGALSHRLRPLRQSVLAWIDGVVAAANLAGFWQLPCAVLNSLPSALASRAKLQAVPGACVGAGRVCQGVCGRLDGRADTPRTRPLRPLTLIGQCRVLGMSTRVDFFQKLAAVLRTSLSRCICV